MIKFFECGFKFPPFHKFSNLWKPKMCQKQQNLEKCQFSMLILLCAKFSANVTQGYLN